MCGPSLTVGSRFGASAAGERGCVNAPRAVAARNSRRLAGMVGSSGGGGNCTTADRRSVEGSRARAEPEPPEALRLVGSRRPTPRIPVCERITRQFIRCRHIAPGGPPVPAIETRDLRKRYRGVEALKGVSIRVEPGEVYGLLGQNGAGKTTLVKILLGIVKPTAGGADLLGRRAGDAAVRKRVGYLPEDHRFPEYHTGWSLLDFYGTLHGAAAVRPPLADRRRPGPRRPRPADALQDPHLLQGHEAAARHRPGAVPRARAGLPRRADRRRRPARPPRDPRDPPGAQGQRRDRVRQLAPAQRGRAGLRPRRHPPPAASWSARARSPS